ncbi:hypothetical protein BJY01DRAFT_230299 [Aspergillus pseudoustus]|uniref:DUF1279 domain-containing protein n=1 Tax=Aspergillus pseudoustus TaxID=1810923 RepID=A0ABR4IB91_9EURO
MSALSSLYRILAIPLLTSWTLTALSFAALDVLNSNRSPIEPIASISLLTYLVCRLLIVSQPQPATSPANQTGNNGDIAHTLTTFHRRSPLGGLISLALAVSWLYELLFKGVLMFFVTIFGGVFATAIYNGAFDQDNKPGSSEAFFGGNEDVNLSGVETTALAEFDELKAKTGVDPTVVIKMIPPKLLVYVVAAVWLNFATLGLYIIRHAWRSLRVAFGGSKKVAATSSEEVVAEKST